MNTTTGTGAVRFWGVASRRRRVSIGAAFVFGASLCTGQVIAPLSTIGALKQLSLDELLDLEVTSVSRRPEKLLESPSAIQVVTGGDIRRSGATNIPDALRLAGNLHVAQKGSHAWGISARGFNTDSANKMLVLVDGRAVYTPLFSGVFWDRQDYLLEDINQIEVISGPGGTLWGANAVNGVISITSKSAEDTQGGYIEAGGGTELRNFAGVRYGGRLAPDVYYRVYAKYTDRDGAARVDGTDAGDSWHAAQGGFRIDALTSAKDTVTVQGDIYRQDEELVTGGSSQVTGGNLLARWSRTFSTDSDVTLQVYYDHANLTLPVPELAFAPAGTFRDELDTYDLDFQHRFRIGARSRIVWGLGYRHTQDAVEDAPALAFVPERLNQDLLSAFVQDEVGLCDDVMLALGIKLEHNDYTGFEVEPGVRLRWNLSPDRMLWAAVSRAVRAPSRIDRDISQPGPDHFIVILKGNSGFVSETLIAYELGYRAQLAAGATLSVSAFYNDYDDLRSTTTSPPDPVFGLPFPFFFENNLEGRTYGIEIDATYHVRDWWRLRGSYNLLKEDIRIRHGRTDFNNALNETTDPEQQISLRSSMDLPGKIEFDVGARWVDSLVANNVGVAAVVPSYAEIDARIGWHVSDSLELSVEGQGLLHDQHGEYWAANSPQVDIERSVYAKVQWHF
jgi:iron complex outermembrane receptor protein